MSRSSHNLPKALLHEHNMRRAGGDRGRTAQRDRHIGFLQCDHVVDAVADKTDLVSFTLAAPEFCG